MLTPKGWDIEWVVLEVLWRELLFRFIAGGSIVLFFALLGDVLRPKSFAALFSAAPSVAIATLTLTLLKDGAETASLEGRSMIFGAIAFFFYAKSNVYFLTRLKWRALSAATLLLPLWFLIALGLWILNEN